MKKILLPTDFSQHSLKTINYALDSFKGRLCTFYLLNLSEVMAYTTPTLLTASPKETLYDTLIGQKQVKLKKLRQGLRRKYTGEEFDFEVLSGHNIFVDAVNNVVELNAIDLICMGTNGISSFRELIFGTHTIRVVRNVKVPVLFVPKDYMFHEYKSIMVTLDYAQRFKAKYVTHLLEVIGKRKCKFLFLRMTEKNVFESEELEMKEIKDSIGANQMEIKRIFNISTIEAIDRMVQDSHIDLNVIPVKKEFLLERLFSGNLMSKAVETTKIPLLIIPGI